MERYYVETIRNDGRRDFVELDLVNQFITIEHGRGPHSEIHRHRTAPGALRELVEKIKREERK